MADIPQVTVGALVAERLGRYQVFEKYGIDYCCGGATPFAAACRAAGHEPEVVRQALADDDAHATRGSEVAEADWTAVPLAELCDHIESTHHAFMKAALPHLGELMGKVLAAHGTGHPELAEVAAVLAGLDHEIGDHLQKEEQVLFPLIRRLEATGAPVQAHCGSVRNPIGVMESEHDHAGDALRRLRDLTADYTAPADACPTYRALLAGLAEMEEDLHLHIHKENNILHPRAMRLENGLAAAARKGSAS